LFGGFSDKFPIKIIELKSERYIESRDKRLLNTKKLRLAQFLNFGVNKKKKRERK